MDGSMVKVAEAEALQQKWKELHESYTQPDRTMSVCEILRGICAEHRQRAAAPGALPDLHCRLSPPV